VLGHLEDPDALHYLGHRLPPSAHRSFPQF
jgi:hypothetical protein